MTTTSERCRALRWGGELLDDLQTKPGLPAAVAERVRSIVQSYPQPPVIEALAAGKAVRLSAEHIHAINEMSVLLRDLSDFCIETQRAVATLRHFPRYGEPDAGFLFWPRPCNEP